MNIQPIRPADLFSALAEGWQMTRRTLTVSLGYASVFVLAGTLILSGLHLTGRTPFMIAAAGAFMLIGPAVLAGFFGIAKAAEEGRTPGLSDITNGFSSAERSLWVLSLVSALLFMIFVTDAGILYAYMVGHESIGLQQALSSETGHGTWRFYQGAMISGAVIALMMYCISAFSVPLLCERRATLVRAVATSVKVVFSHFFPALLWAIMLSIILIGSILLLPLLLVTLPWLAHASRALYRRTLLDD